MKRSTSTWTALKDVNTAKRVSLKRKIYSYLTENCFTESFEDTIVAAAALTATGTVINDSGIINASQLSSNVL